MSAIFLTDTCHVLKNFSLRCDVDEENLHCSNNVHRGCNRCAQIKLLEWDLAYELNGVLWLTNIPTAPPSSGPKFLEII
jgi:hypothetical protein